MTWFCCLSICLEKLCVFAPHSLKIEGSARNCLKWMPVGRCQKWCSRLRFIHDSALRQTPLTNVFTSTDPHNNNNNTTTTTNNNNNNANHQKNSGIFPPPQKKKKHNTLSPFLNGERGGLVTFKGARSTPATRQCPKLRALLPSSKAFTTTAWVDFNHGSVDPRTRPHEELEIRLGKVKKISHRFFTSPVV